MREISEILKSIKSGQTGCTAYDTSWIALLSGTEPEMSNGAIQWICEHQLPDGSWGAEAPLYYHDRVISTLSAMIILTRRGRRSQDRLQIESGLRALEWITSGATKGLASDPNGATVGFEMLLPSLVAEAEKLGIIKQQSDRILGRISRLRDKKLEKLAGLKINRNITPAFSAEMAGSDMQLLLDPENLQENNGSVGNSPSATAYFALNIKPGNEKALEYLRETTPKGGAPFAAPFDVFERSWILWNLALLRPSDPDILTLVQPHLAHLQSAWQPGYGVGFSANYTPCDSDDTSMTFDAMASFGRKLDIETLLSYEEENHFRCYAMEITPSIGANVHILSALRHTNSDKDHPTIQKIVKFLRKTRQMEGYWFDKWHASPFYITSHAIIALQGYDNQLCSDAVDWIIKAQRADGSWGFYEESTAEETAYAIQALKVWEKNKGRVPAGRIEHGIRWLEQHTEPPYPPMWISKALYCPELVVETIIATALEM